MGQDKKCDKPVEYEKLKVKTLCNKNLHSKNAKISNAEIENIDAAGGTASFGSITADSGKFNSLDTNTFSIAGEDFTCKLFQQSVATGGNDDYIPFPPPEGFVPENVNPVVYEALNANVSAQATELACHLYDGRSFIDTFLQGKCPLPCPEPERGEVPGFCFVDFTGSIAPGDNNKGVLTVDSIADSTRTIELGKDVIGAGVAPNTIIECQISGEPGLTGEYRVSVSQTVGKTNLQTVVGTNPVLGPLKPVPLNIFGTITLPIYDRITCDETGSTEDILNTAVNFNLQTSYLLETTNSTSPRTISVLVQLAYIDADTELPVVEEIFTANRQIGPTIDIFNGENFANTISIPTDLLDLANRSSLDPTNQGAVQLVIYIEEGLCVRTPSGCVEFAGQDTISCSNSLQGNSFANSVSNKYLKNKMASEFKQKKQGTINKNILSKRNVISLNNTSVGCARTFSYLDTQSLFTLNNVNYQYGPAPGTLAVAGPAFFTKFGDSIEFIEIGLGVLNSITTNTPSGIYKITVWSSTTILGNPRPSSVVKSVDLDLSTLTRLENSNKINNVSADAFYHNGGENSTLRIPFNLPLSQISSVAYFVGVQFNNVARENGPAVMANNVLRGPYVNARNFVNINGDWFESLTNSRYTNQIWTTPCISTTKSPTAIIRDTALGNRRIRFNSATNNFPTSYLWDFGDGQTSTLANVTHTYAQTGTYNVSLKVSNNNGENTTTKQITVTDISPAAAQKQAQRDGC